MANKCEFHIHEENACQIFAITLERIALATALSRFGENYHGQFSRRLTDWRTCLINVGAEDF